MPVERQMRAALARRRWTGRKTSGSIQRTPPGVYDSVASSPRAITPVKARISGATMATRERVVVVVSFISIHPVVPDGLDGHFFFRRRSVEHHVAQRFEHRLFDARHGAVGRRLLHPDDEGAG